MIKDPDLIGAARKFLVGRVGISSANTEYFLHLLEGEEFAAFKNSLEKGEVGNAESQKVLSAYLKGSAKLREKAILLANLLGITDEEDRACFIAETVSRRERFLALEKVTAEQLQTYVEKVKSGMSTEQAMRELRLAPNMAKFETVHESFDFED